MTANNKLSALDMQIRETKKRLAVLLNRKLNICQEAIEECDKHPDLYSRPSAIKARRQWDIEAINSELAKVSGNETMKEMTQATLSRLVVDGLCECVSDATRSGLVQVRWTACDVTTWVQLED